MVTSNPPQNFEDFLATTITLSQELKALFTAIGHADFQGNAEPDTDTIHLARLGAARAANMENKLAEFLDSIA